MVTYTEDIRGETFMDGMRRKNIKPGLKVAVVQKQDQRSGHLTEGTVKQILTRSATHPHGIKVRLTSGQVGRVKVIYQGQDDNSVVV